MYIHGCAILTHLCYAVMLPCILVRLAIPVELCIFTVSVDTATCAALLHMDVFMLRCCPVSFSAYTELLRIVGATATDAVTYMCYAVMLPRFLQCNWLFCTNSYTHSSSYGYDCVCVLLRCYAIMEGYYLTAYIHSCCRYGHWHCVYVHSVMC